MCLMAREPGFKDSSLAMHIILKNVGKNIAKAHLFLSVPF